MARQLRLVEGVDYYMEDDKLVFTAHYLLKRGYCCNTGCRHCPYGDKPLASIGINIVGPRARDDDDG